jgi:hypothetical protein
MHAAELRWGARSGRSIATAEAQGFGLVTNFGRREALANEACHGEWRALFPSARLLREAAG